MIQTIATALVSLATAIGTSNVEVRIATPSLTSKSVISSLEKACKVGISAKVILGAKADLDEKGEPISMNRPFDNGPQGPEIKRLAAMRAQVYIPPRFNELGPLEFQPGVAANMAYAVVGHESAYLCTGPFSQGINGLCWVDESKPLVEALIGVHEADFNYKIPPNKQAALLQYAVEQDVLVTPERAPDFDAILAMPWQTIHTALLSDGPVVDALLKSNSRAHMWLSPAAPHARTAIQRLRVAGWFIGYTKLPFTGTVMVSSSAVFIGSQRLDNFQIKKSRDVGMMLPSTNATDVRKYLSILGESAMH